MNAFDSYKLKFKLSISLLMLFFTSTAYAFDPDDYDWTRSDLYLGGEEHVEYSIADYAPSATDKKKRLITETFAVNGKLESKTKHSYDASGKVIKVENFNAKGKLEDYTEKSYNGAGLLVRKETYNRRRKLQEYTTYEYDSDNKLVKTNDYTRTGKLEAFMLVGEYDRLGNPTRMEIYNEGDRSPGLLIINNYNNDNKLTRLALFPIDEEIPFFEVRYTYKAN